MSYLRYLCLIAYKSGVQHKYIVLCFCFVFSSSCLLYVANFSVLSIFDCPFGILERLFTECIQYTSILLFLILGLLLLCV